MLELYEQISFLEELLRSEDGEARVKMIRDRRKELLRTAMEYEDYFAKEIAASNF